MPPASPMRPSRSPAPPQSRIVRANSSERGVSTIFKASWVVVFMATEMSASFWNFFFLDFLANVAAIDVIYVGVIATSMRIFDAVTDPIVGGMSDRSNGHCGFGRRRFCIVVSFVPFAVSWFTQFTVPFSNKDALFWWYLLGSLVANWLWTWMMIPTVALLNEFCTNDKERTLLSTGRFIATGVGSAISTGGQAAVFSSSLDEETQFALLAMIFAGGTCLMVANMLWWSRTLVEGEAVLSNEDTTWRGLLSNYSAVFKVRQFILVAILYIVSVVSMQFTLNILPFFIRQYLLYTRADVTSVIGIGLASGFVFLVPVLVMGSPSSRVHINKRTMYFIGASIWISFFALIPFVQITNDVKFTCINATAGGGGNETYTLVVHGGKEASGFPCGIANTLDYELVRSDGAMGWLYALAPIFGSGIAVTLIVPVALLNDVADVVTLETGLSNEGLVIGLGGLLYKSLAGLLLIGYFGTLRSNNYNDKNEWERESESEASQLELIPWEARETIRYWMMVPVGLLALGLFVNKFSSITPAYMERVQSELKRRSKGQLPSDSSSHDGEAEVQMIQIEEGERAAPSGITAHGTPPLSFVASPQSNPGDTRSILGRIAHVLSFPARACRAKRSAYGNTMVPDDFVALTAANFPWAQDDVELLIDTDELEASIVKLLVSAKKSVHYSFFICDMKKPVTEDGRTLGDLFDECVERGVEVKFMYNPTSDYGNEDVTSFIKSLNPAITAVRVEGDGLIDEWWIAPFSANKFWSNHHQKFMCIDLERIMVTGVDVNNERMGWMEANHFGYFWHELSVVLPVNEAMKVWLLSHFETLNVDTVPGPLLSGGRTEHSLMCDMIATAEHSVHLENQVWVSGDSKIFRNQISRAIVERICRAVNATAEGKTDDFRCVLSTNIGQDDEPSGGTRWFCRNGVLWSYAYIQKECAAQGITPEQLAERFVAVEFRVAGEEREDEILLKIHSNMLCTDSNYLIRTSSNLLDRSIWAQADSELGVGVSGPCVAAMQQRLFHRYLPTLDAATPISFETYFDAARSGESFFRPIANSGSSYWALEKKLWLATKLAGSIVGFGKKVNWTNTPEQGGSVTSAKDVTKARSSLQHILK